MTYRSNVLKDAYIIWKQDDHRIVRKDFRYSPSTIFVVECCSKDALDSESWQLVNQIDDEDSIFFKVLLSLGRSIVSSS